MKKVLFIFFIAMLFGAGCKNGQATPVDFGKMQQALTGIGRDLGWEGEVIEKVPSEENFFGRAFIFYGPFRQEAGDVVLSDSIEIIEYDNINYASNVYKQTECFKGRGEPYNVFGTDSCCLNDKVKGSSQAVMLKENYIIRSFDYFHADCGAGQYLKKFWGEYLKE
ncbi:MAG: hypothetical protein WC459_04790 [Patescibacteria group bacterium]